jgi:methylmalonyl-CoA mutase
MHFTNEFNTVSKADWLEQVNRELKGKPIESILKQPSRSGVQTEPYYTLDEVGELNYLEYFDYGHMKGSGRPGSAGWLNRVMVQMEDEGTTRKEIIDLQSAGVNSVMIAFDKPVNDWNALISGISMDHFEIGFCFEDLALAKEVMEPFLLQCGDHHFAGFVLIDQSLEWFIDHEQDLVEWYHELIPLTTHFKNLKTLTIPGYAFHDAGLDPVQEISAILDYTAHLLETLAKHHIRPDVFLNKMILVTATGSKYLEDIAKIRVYRQLLYQIFSAYEVPNLDCSDIRIDVHTSRWYLSLQDKHNNMLRSVTAAMSAILGGASAVYVRPFDTLFKDYNHFSQRIAKNVSVLLSEESHLDKMQDPVAGSYYFRVLIDALAKICWRQFQDLQRNPKDLNDRKEELLAIARHSIKAYEQGEEILVGVNKYMNEQEQFEPGEIERQQNFFNPSTHFLNRSHDES